MCPKLRKSRTSTISGPETVTILVWLALSVLFFGSLPAPAESQQAQMETPAGSPAEQRPAGTISGSVKDPTGGVVANARVQLSRSSQPDQDAVSGDDGQYSFANVTPGPFELTVSFEGFATQTYSGILQPGENAQVPAITLAVAAAAARVQVVLSRYELAEAEIRDQEQQRVFGVLPNFYVTYNADAVPLHPKQKFELAWKSTLDPVNFGLTAAVAGIQQANNSYPEYGPGTKGYAKRYGAAYADLVTGNFVGSALVPTVLRQDPRYFYKGTGSIRSRILYAIASSVVCKGDNGKWQANYSGVAGGLAAAELSRLYRPASDHGAVDLIESALTIIGSTAADNILQEFLIRKLTPRAPTYAPAKP
jgi:hypothetical protein